MSISFSPDTIQEFSVQQANYSAQYAQAGGAIIQQTTKSGTNELHGTGFWFHRQKAFTANPFDSQRSPVTNFDNRPPLRRQQLGVVLTGPVTIPKLYKGKDRTFFMFSFEPTRQLASNPGGASNIRIPDEREIAGDFSQSLVYFRNANGTVRTEPFALLYNQFNRRPDGALALRPNPAFNPASPASATNFTHQYIQFPLFNPTTSGRPDLRTTATPASSITTSRRITGSPSGGPNSPSSATGRSAMPSSTASSATPTPPGNCWRASPRPSARP